MIEKMKFLNIEGPKDDIDRVVSDYLSRYEIDLENAFTQLSPSAASYLKPFIEVNPYKDAAERADRYASMMGLPREPGEEARQAAAALSPQRALDTVQQLEKSVSSLTEQKQALQEEEKKKQELLTQLLPYRNIPVDIDSILHLQYISFRFGRISRYHVKRLLQYVDGEIDTLFCQGSADDKYVWGVYFAPKTVARRIDAAYAALHFERQFIPDVYDGIPTEACAALEKEIQGLQSRIGDLERQASDVLKGSEKQLEAAGIRLHALSGNFDVRKMAALTDSGKDGETYYILCGWMSEKDAASFEREAAGDDQVTILEDDTAQKGTSPGGHMPPTRLRNPKIFRPFEMFIRMYGLPAYNEIDPTVFVALSYSFLFGCMFGDVGQGLVLLLGGALVFRKTRKPIAGILSSAGIFSTLFGFLYGSFFGFEDVIPALWLHPKEAMTTLPLIGRLNTVFVVAVAFGMFMILAMMVLHMINAKKAGEKGSALFDSSGLAGFIFYGFVVLEIFLLMTGHKAIAGAGAGIVIALTLVSIAFKDALGAWIEKRKPDLGGSAGMYIVTAFFELFDVILSFFSNTVSFVRVGAFAVSHAAMMEVVLMLAGYESKGLAGTNWAVVVIGNLFVMGMEGLIVGIQVLRLEYYELFSRFYKGTGRPFHSFIRKQEV